MTQATDPNPNTAGAVAGPQIFELNMGQMQEDADRADDSQFANLVDGTTCFFVLPPWSQRGLLAKPVYKAFLGKKKTHISWKTFEHTAGWEEASQRDPLYLTLKELQTVFGKDDERIKALFPRTRFYANVIIHSTQDGKSGEYKEWKPKSSIIQLPKGVYDYLCREIVKPNIGSIVNPNAAVCVVVEKSGKGLDTEYKKSLAGQVVPGQGFQPTRENLFQKYGEEIINEILAKLPNLDEIWTPPSEADQVKAQQLAEEVRQAISSGAAVAGTYQAPGGAGAFGAPPPGTQIQAPVAPGAFAGTPAAPGLAQAPVAQGAPVAPVSAPAAPGTTVPLGTNAGAPVVAMAPVAAAAPAVVTAPVVATAPPPPPPANPQ